MDEKVIACDVNGKITYYNKAAQHFHHVYGLSTEHIDQDLSFYSSDRKRKLDFDEHTSIPLPKRRRGYSL